MAFMKSFGTAGKRNSPITNVPFGAEDPTRTGRRVDRPGRRIDDRATTGRPGRYSLPPAAVSA
ncbi:hypothetical protein [Paenibacillus graminis]|uniref:hypothetical protein n=1 Tax=Paenibacillus graminis TaxID=189425 RepID=UPI0012E0827B|nr:hypothetical protein [Paenibacillus graminis]